MELADSLLWLCRIASPIGEERALCDAIVERLQHCGRANGIRRYGDSIVVPLARNGGPKVVLAGHLDVVRTEHDAPPRIDADRLYGAGAADMKSGLCLMLELCERPSLPRIDLTLVFYAREEGPYLENELGRVLAEDPELSRADVAVLLEPSDNKLQLGCGGSLHATLRFQGRTAHSARPWQGENAIHKAAGLLARLSAQEPHEDRVDGLIWHEVTSATLARGGRARNIIPDEFELNVNHRFGPSTTLAVAEERISKLVQHEAEVEFVDRSPAAPPFRQHPLIHALAESGVRAVEPKQAWTDVARFAALGVPAVNFGPGVQAQAHQRNEWTSIAQLDVGQSILDRWLTSLAALALVASVGLSLSACSESRAPQQQRAEAVPSSSESSPGPSLFSRSALNEALAAIQARVGDASVLRFELSSERASIQVQNPSDPARVVQYEWKARKLSGPTPVELRGKGNLSTNLFPLSGVDLSGVPDLVKTAIDRVDPEHGKVTSILVRRNLPADESIGMRVYVQSPIRDGHVDADAHGRLVEASRVP